MSTYPSGNVHGLCLPPGRLTVTVDLGEIAGDWSDLPDRVQVVPADAIVIPREDLPEVVPDGTVEGIDGEPVARFRAGGWQGFAGDGKSSRASALAHLALAEYLDAHPPVDEAKVEALAGLVRDGGPGVLTGITAEHLARRLLATGRIEVKP